METIYLAVIMVAFIYFIFLFSKYTKKRTLYPFFIEKLLYQISSSHSIYLEQYLHNIASIPISSEINPTL